MRKNLTECNMLKEFRVSNFKSINKEQIFSMEACSPREITEHPSHVINYKGERLLKVSSFYGPNGGGKSNLLDAYLVMRTVVAGFQLPNSSYGNDNYMKCIFCKNKNSIFEVFYVIGDFEIGYSLEVNLNNIVEEHIERGIVSLVNYEIVKEEVCVRRLDTNETFILFERDSKGVVNSEFLLNVDLITNSVALPKNKSFLNYFKFSFSDSSNDENFQIMFNLFNEMLESVLFSREHHHYTFDEKTVKLFEPYLDKTAEILNGVDIRVKALKFKRIYPRVYCLYVLREAENGDITEIQIASESKGTKKLINIIFDVLVNNRCKLFIADDFDACLHPKLIRAVIELFTSSKNNTKQLIFNSHDIVNMNNKVFRRDEIWFAFRDENYATIYIPLSNIVNYKGEMVRKDAVFGKQYLEGKYGADPFIKQGLEWE